MRRWLVGVFAVLFPVFLLAEVDATSATDAITDGMTAAIGIFQPLIVAFSVFIGYRMVLFVLRWEGYIEDVPEYDKELDFEEDVRRYRED
jgi:uncharacterized oligopeptide transporter (OPT) family protein